MSWFDDLPGELWPIAVAVAVILVRFLRHFRRIEVRPKQKISAPRQRASLEPPPPGPTLTVFPAPTTEGDSLAEAIRADAGRLGYQVSIHRSATREQVFEACIESDAVVFDASFDGEHPDQMAAAIYILRSQYVVTVSRRDLPLSFPDFDPVAPPRGALWDTERCASEVRNRLDELRGALPRPKHLKGVGNWRAIAETAVDEMIATRRRNIFISYRGSKELDVAELAHALDGGAVPRQDVRFFRSGELAMPNEVLSLLRRWEVLGSISRWIRSAETFWVYETADYLDSWWTQAELVVLALYRDVGSGSLDVYDPADASRRPADPAWLPALTRSQKDRIEDLLLLGRNAEYASRIDPTRSSLAIKGNMDALIAKLGGDLLLPCRITRASGGDPQIDVEDFIEGRASQSHAISHVAALEILNGTGRGHCPGCGALYRFTYDASRYRWYPTRKGIGTGPGHTTIEKLPVILADELL